MCVFPACLFSLSLSLECPAGASPRHSLVLPYSQREGGLAKPSKELVCVPHILWPTCSLIEPLAPVRPEFDTKSVLQLPNQKHLKKKAVIGPFETRCNYRSFTPHILLSPFADYPITSIPLDTTHSPTTLRSFIKQP